MGVVVAVAGRGAVEWRSEPSRFMAEHGFEDHAGAVVEFPDDLVAGDERERDPVLEVQRSVTFDEREVGAADTGESGVHPMPAGPRQFGLVDARVLERSEFGRGHRRDRRGNARHAESGDRT